MRSGPSILERNPAKPQQYRLAIALWDAATLYTRQAYQQDTRNRLSLQGQKSAWRRWKREQAILAMQPMVLRVAKDVRWMFAPHLDLRDLTQAGMIGLMKAANAFNPARASAAGFEPYAYFRVRGAIIDSQKRRVYREEQHDSLDRPIGRGNDPDRATRGDALPCRKPLGDELAEREEIHRLLHQAIMWLPDDQRDVINGHLAGQRLAVTAKQVGRSLTWTRAKLAEAREAVTVAMRAA
jgi:RNA polymerase sigma factor (sigma-70 family)